jgi:hypothetical protein
MNQILHIFRKDARKHWLEILISLTLLGLYARRQLPLWPEPPGSLQIGSLFFSQVAGLITPALVLFWAFLILRLVQDESLVGDRQWWVTKPYIWWKLLIAKILFAIVFISIPLFLADLFLLRHAGFPILSNLWGLVRMQLFLPLVIIVFSLVLACLTRNLPQALLGIGLVLACLIAVSWLMSGLRGHTMTENSKLWDRVQNFLMFAPLILVPIWQFARRRTWASRGVLLGCFTAVTLLSLIPGNRIEQSYPLVSAHDAPAQFTISATPQTKEQQPAWPGPITETILSVRVNISDIAADQLVVVEGLQLNADSAEESRWSSGWQWQNLYLWPEKQSDTVNYTVKRKEYEKIKSQPLNLRVQLLLSEYKETNVRTLILPTGVFRDAQFGLCRVNPLSPGAIECLEPFRTPSYIARFDEAHSPCASSRENAESAPSDVGPAYASGTLTEEPSSAALNPLVEYQLYFNFASVPAVGLGYPEGTYRPVTLCPGAEVQITRPAFQRKVRVQIDLPHQRLEDLVQELQGGGTLGTSIDLRSM